MISLGETIVGVSAVLFCDELFLEGKGVLQVDEED